MDARTFLLAIAVALSISCKKQPVQETAISESEADSDGWKSIWLSQKRKLTSVNLSLSTELDVHRDLSIARLVDFVEEDGLDDSLSKSLVTEGLRLPLRLAIPDDPEFGAGGAPVVIGKIELMLSTGEKVSISIFSGSFVLGEEYFARRVFFSPALARFVDDWYLRQSSKRLPKQIVENLSGLGYINERIKTYEMILSHERPDLNDNK